MTKKLQPPPNMPPEAAAEWKRIVAILSKTKSLTEADIAALSIYATSYAVYQEAGRKVSEQGTVVIGTTGTPVKNPYLTVQKEAWDRLRMLLIELGLTPRSRAAMAKLAKPETEDAGELQF